MTSPNLTQGHIPSTSQFRAWLAASLERLRMRPAELGRAAWPEGGRACANIAARILSGQTESPRLETCRALALALVHEAAARGVDLPPLCGADDA